MANLIRKKSIARKESLVGGKADMRSSREFSASQLKQGIAIEREHTNNPAIAEEIARDHLAEDPQYYTKLKKAGL